MLNINMNISLSMNIRIQIKIKIKSDSFKKLRLILYGFSKLAPVEVMDLSCGAVFFPDRAHRDLSLNVNSMSLGL